MTQIITTIQNFFQTFGEEAPLLNQIPQVQNQIPLVPTAAHTENEFQEIEEEIELDAIEFDEIELNAIEIGLGAIEFDEIELDEIELDEIDFQTEDVFTPF